MTVYLVDGVTGGVVHHTSHKQAAGPVHLVHSENWIMVRLGEIGRYPPVMFLYFVERERGL